MRGRASAARILVLGRTGQIGWELCRTLAPLGTVIGAGRPDVDLADSAALRAFVTHAGADIVVNAAGWTGVDAAEQDEAAAHAINATAPGVIAEALAKHGGVLIHYSSDYVFDGASGNAYDEDAAPNPLGAYGRSKLAGERAVRASGVAHVILRTSWVYGLRGTNFLRTMIRLGRERDELRVVSDQTGAPTWSRLIAEATAQLVAAAGASLADLRATYHLTSAGACTWHEFAVEIMKRWYGADAPRVQAVTTAEYGARAPRPANSRLDCERLRAEFGIALPDWRAALELVHAESAAR